MHGAIVIFAVEDVERSAAFYRQAFAWTARVSTPVYVELETAGARCLSPRAVRPWGDEAAYYADPDGNVIAVAKTQAVDSRPGS